MDQKYSFVNDYSEGVHESILRSLEKTNSAQEKGYGEDSFTLSAKERIRKYIASDTAAIHFVASGTQANLITLSSILRPHESIIAPETGHICVHEAGAIEATGHKIHTAPTNDGKLSVDTIRHIVGMHHDEHMVKPKAVFISQSTERGTIYSKTELENISSFCRKNNLYLYLDGARLGSALTCATNDLTLAEITQLVDAYYIGGTKNGALFGEAIIIPNTTLQNDFRYLLKQKGALLAKGRAIGIQFETLFTDDLFFNLGRHANEMAQKLAEGIQQRGHPFLAPAFTNQLFPIFPCSLIKKLEKNFLFYTWKSMDAENAAIRLVTSWATPPEAVDAFLAAIKNHSLS